MRPYQRHQLSPADITARTRPSLREATTSGNVGYTDRGQGGSAPPLRSLFPDNQIPPEYLAALGMDPASNATGKSLQSRYGLIPSKKQDCGCGCSGSCGK